MTKQRVTGGTLDRIWLESRAILVSYYVYKKAGLLLIEEQRLVF